MLPVMKSDYNVLLTKVNKQAIWIDENRRDERHAELMLEYIENTEKLNALLVLIEESFEEATDEEVKFGF